MSVSLCWKSRMMCFLSRTFVIVLALSTFALVVAVKKEAVPTSTNTKKADSGKSANTILNKHSEPIIEDVTSKQLEKVLNEKDYVAVFWCKYMYEYITLDINI